MDRATADEPSVMGQSVIYHHPVPPKSLRSGAQRVNASNELPTDLM